MDDVRNLSNAQCAARANEIISQAIIARHNHLQAQGMETEEDLDQIKLMLRRMADTHHKRYRAVKEYVAQRSPV